MFLTLGFENVWSLGKEETNGEQSDFSKVIQKTYD